MNVVVNGKARDVQKGSTIADLISALGLGARHVVVERNGEPVPRDRFRVEMLTADDVLEIVRPVQGG
ncbi:MAG: sulfur carrier protein ThiS [Actinomycetota bacterium]